jgi:hypothetical protein
VYMVLLTTEGSCKLILVRGGLRGVYNISLQLPSVVNSTIYTALRPPLTNISLQLPSVVNSTIYTPLRPL